MAAPKKVKDMASMADRLIAQRAEGTTPPGEPTAPIVPVPDLSVVGDETAGKVSETPPQSATNKYAVDPVAQPARTVAPAAATGPMDWQHKYNIVQGILTRANLENADKIQQLENQIDALTVMARRPSREDTFHPEAVPVITDYGMTEEEVESLGGQDFIDSIAKISAAGSANEIATLRGEVDALRQTQSESSEVVFYSQLSSACPSWRDINKNDAFSAWLLGDEGLSGIAKKNFLDNAYENLDAETAARYFNEFLRLLPGSPGLDPTVISEIIPNTSGGGAPPQSNPRGNLYTPASIQTFFKDKGLGKFKGREDEADAIERDIFAAQREGRVILRKTQTM